MMEIIPYQIWHIEEILKKHPREYELKWATSPDWKVWLWKWKKDGPAYTVKIDDELVMCAGVIYVSKYIGECWMVLSSLFPKYRKTCFKAIKTYLDKTMSSYGLRRLQAMVDQDFQEAHHFLIHLGFRSETPDGMKYFGPNGETMYLYGRY